MTVTSRSGSVSCPIRLMEGVNPLTAWTWSAIGKCAGAWMLAPDAPKSRQGFFFSHVMATFLPEREGRRLPSSDPVTGQPAWYDMRVRMEKAARGTVGTAPQQPSLSPLRGKSVPELPTAKQRVRA